MNSNKFFQSLLFGVLLFFMSLILAWGLMYKFNFFYGIWHDYGGIGAGIEKFGPQNRYKKGFADTTKAQREALFHEIAVAVHSGGSGLAEISYQSPSSQGQQTLLREPEVVHLQDVANLLSFLAKLVAAFIAIWLIFVGVYLKQYRSFPRLREQLGGVVGLLVLLGLVLVVAGAENVFNTLHIWVFPAENQWFFYYQNSLMSTMMLAPVLFAWIAGAWLVLTLGIFFVVNALMSTAVFVSKRHLPA